MKFIVNFCSTLIDKHNKKVVVAAPIAADQVKTGEYNLVLAYCSVLMHLPDSLAVLL
jgi:hypothetical protein